MECGTAVVIAGKKDFVTVQAFGHGEGLRDLSQGNVSKDKHPVGRSDCRVPILNDGLIHVIWIRERATAVPADVGMPEMEIGSDPALPHGDPFLSTLFVRINSILRNSLEKSLTIAWISFIYGTGLLKHLPNLFSSRNGEDTHDVNAGNGKDRDDLREKRALD
jgi:hypothetical protein